MKKNSKPVVVLLHGVWLNGLVMRYLARYLKKYFDFDTRIYTYPTLTRDLAGNAESLNNYLNSLDSEVVHLVGHSLGGLLIRALFHYYPEQAQGRVVMLGAPSRGSCVARRLGQHGSVRWLLGRAIPQYLKESASWAPVPRELGVIAGTSGVGIGRLLARVPTPNDGTVAVSEVLATDSRDQVALPVSHTTMLFSSRVAEQVGVFLSTGVFGAGKNQD